MSFQIKKFKKKGKRRLVRLSIILNYISLTAKSHVEEDNGWDDMKRWHASKDTNACISKKISSTKWRGIWIFN